jgi:hypothetical protein
VPRIPRIAGRGVPWMLLLDAGRVAREHWQKLTPSERSKLGRLIKKSKGRMSNLTTRERVELRRIANKLDLPEAAKKMVPFGGALRRKR